MMKRKAGVVSAVGGTISMILGLIGFCIACPPVCGGICIAGPLVAIFGVGIIAFLAKYNVWFVALGGIIFLLGVSLMFKYRKRCDPGSIDKYLNDIGKYYRIAKCRDCECLQGFLTQLEIDGANEKTMKKIGKMIVSKDIHKCLGCDPCPPGEIFTSYLKEKKQG